MSVLPRGCVYRASDPDVIDGDTLWLTVYLDPASHLRLRCRLWGIDAPEWNGFDDAAASLARTKLNELISQAQDISILVRQGKRDKYGRELISLTAHGHDGKDRDAAQFLLAQGVVIRYLPGTANYGTPHWKRTTFHPRRALTMRYTRRQKRRFLDTLMTEVENDGQGTVH